jgi:N-acetylneuraminate synthase/N,N'-diacetyllegionaminate synthase
VPSGELTNLPFLEQLARTSDELIVSTGMSWLCEVEAAVRTVQTAGCPRLTLLHCVTEYPAPIDQVNLSAMGVLASAFGLPVGYSDHTAGIDIPIAAVALGATVIEKHFTLDPAMSGPDHAASLNPEDFSKMVQAIRNTEQAIGDGRKRPADCELGNVSVVRKSLVAARDLRAGESLSPEDITIKRPGTGLAPALLTQLVGRRARRDIRADELLAWRDVD